MSAHYAQLLPAPTPVERPAGHNDSRQVVANQILLRRKRTQVPFACLACRNRKAKCDGQRPTCSGCLAKHLECVYDVEQGEVSRYSSLKRKYSNLRNQHDQLSELYRFLHMRPEPEAQEIYKLIRSSKDPMLVLRDVKEADLLLFSPPTKSVASEPDDPVLVMEEDAVTLGQRRFSDSSLETKAWRLLAVTGPPGLAPGPD